MREVLRLLVCTAVFGGLATFLLASSDGEKSPARAPHRSYFHVISTNKPCKFVLNGKTGTADYYWSGKRCRDGLVFLRYARMSDPGIGERHGWIYQVENKGEKEQWWFFFPETPTRICGIKTYPMYYTYQLPNKDGQQHWTRIRTPNGTKMAEIEEEEEEPIK